MSNQITGSLNETCCGAGPVSAGSALIVTGGHSHPAADSVVALRSVLDRFDLTVEVSEDPDQAFCGLAATGPDLLLVNALRFMMTHERYADHRDEWALSLSDEARRAITEWVRSGGRLLALHAALVSFDDWSGWGDLIGGAWNWERSSHPPVGPVMVTCSGTTALVAEASSADDPAGTKAPSAPARFTVTDECYVDLDVRDGIELIATASADGVAEHPAAWIRPVGDGRVATSTLGHDLRSLGDPDHCHLLRGLVGWLLEPTPDRRDDLTETSAER